MAPVSLLCKGFLDSLLTTNRTTQKTKPSKEDDVQIVDDDDDDPLRSDAESDDDDDDEVNAKIESRRIYLNHKSDKSAAATITTATATDQLMTDKELKRLLKRTVILKL